MATQIPGKLHASCCGVLITEDRKLTTTLSAYNITVLIKDIMPMASKNKPTSFNYRTIKRSTNHKVTRKLKYIPLMCMV